MSGKEGEDIRSRLKPDTTIKVRFQEDQPCRFVIGYWGIRGLAAPIRAMLSYAKVNHEVALYDVKETGESGWSKDSWFDDKGWMKEELNPLMNLPFLVDCQEGMVVNQSNAIMSYVGEELHLMGTTKKEKALCLEMLCEVMDLRNVMVGFAYGTDGSSEKAQGLLKRSKGHFNKIGNHLKRKGDSEPFLVGKGATAPDFHLWEMLDQYMALTKKFEMDSYWTEHEELKNYWEKFGDLHGYRASFAHTSLPFNNPYAHFGNHPTPGKTYERGTETPWKGKAEISESHSRKRKNDEE
mmetsp:Transcript_23563/g.33768  ORF Transcript_23563/g.33768 Transcript_23563/m.33768 type:complete len:295 (+) Transcript_23563:31-915(+)